MSAHCGLCGVEGGDAEHYLARTGQLSKRVGELEKDLRSIREAAELIVECDDNGCVDCRGSARKIVAAVDELVPG